MKKLLLTGASGFLGWNICKVAEKEWQVHGIVHNSSFSIPNIITHRLNLTNDTSLKKLFNEIQPDAVIHAAAISDTNYCQQHPVETYLINAVATFSLAELCAERKIPFVFTSSDQVFDGTKGNYNESDEPNPANKYGEQKAEAERLVIKIYPESAVCRMPLMIGDGGPGAKGYLHAFLAKAKNGEAMKLFTDEFRSPVGGISAATGLIHALNHFKGIYHLGGNERLSRFELGQKIAKAFEIMLTQLIPAKQSEMQMSAPRPADVSMISRKAYSEGFEPQIISNELAQLYKLPSSVFSGGLA